MIIQLFRVSWSSWLNGLYMGQEGERYDDCSYWQKNVSSVLPSGFMTLKNVYERSCMWRNFILYFYDGATSQFFAPIGSKHWYITSTAKARYQVIQDTRVYRPSQNCPFIARLHPNNVPVEEIKYCFLTQLRKAIVMVSKTIHEWIFEICNSNYVMCLLFA